MNIIRGISERLDPRSNGSIDNLPLNKRGVFPYDFAYEPLRTEREGGVVVISMIGGFGRCRVIFDTLALGLEGGKVGGGEGGR